MPTAKAQQRLHCPACRTIRTVQQVGTCTVNNRRHTLVQCTDTACELTWATRTTATTRGRAA
ncbi:hypothetical protein [Streptomyces sp. ADI98-10]|uniref:hypothetical protein n=1 Tax=Streptomyces sp. ADI98-10 TaxID=1522763 RepID=UPI000F54E09E|nr:hypothetical protein [Streptomyces sp. ADI98-10]RPK93777.1 hypothetical protein EES46_04850 [Streptomyces sp. ADI98-10]